jgi:hypothetical protein
MDASELDEAALKRCVEEAGFTFRDGTPWRYSIGVGGGMRYLHRYAAEWFARRYLAEHGRLPEGRHHVRVTAYARDQRGLGRHQERVRPREAGGGLGHVPPASSPVGRTSSKAGRITAAAAGRRTPRSRAANRPLKPSR